LGRILPNPWDRLVAGLSVVAVGAAASVVSGSGASRGDATLVVLAALMVSVLWPRREHLAWFAGAMLPVQAIDGASSDMIEVLRVAVGLLAVLRDPADLTGPGTKIVARLVTLLVALTAVQLVFGVARDPFLPTVRMIALSAVTISVAWVV